LLLYQWVNSQLKQFSARYSGYVRVNYTDFCSLYQTFLDIFNLLYAMAKAMEQD